MLYSQRWNLSHPFGVRLWKPALYKKDRSISQAAFRALHSTPQDVEQNYLSFSNIAWTLLFGWWLAVAYMLVGVCCGVSLFISKLCNIFAICISQCRVIYIEASETPSRSRQNLMDTAFNMAWYIVWPFGRYVELRNVNGRPTAATTFMQSPDTQEALGKQAGISSTCTFIQIDNFNLFRN
jgi:Ca2+:H+ antiporter